MAEVAATEAAAAAVHLPTYPEQRENSAERQPAPEDMALHVEDLCQSQEFINGIKNATLESSCLDPDCIKWLKEPQQSVEELDPNLHHSIDMFLANITSSKSTYALNREAHLRHYPNNDILSLESVKKKVAELTGVVLILEHMCPNTCIAYTGPFSELDNCPKCQQPCYDVVKLAATGGKVKLPLHEFVTVPIGPQIQAMWAHKETAKEMTYGCNKRCEVHQQLRNNGGKLAKYNDVFCG